MSPKQIFLRMHERAPWNDRNVYNREIEIEIEIPIGAYQEWHSC
jgi:hypothetical protein